LYRNKIVEARIPFEVYVNAFRIAALYYSCNCSRRLYIVVLMVLYWSRKSRLMP